MSEGRRRYLTGDRRKAELVRLGHRGLGVDPLTPALVLDQLTAERAGQPGPLRETAALRKVRLFRERKPALVWWFWGPYGTGKTAALAYAAASRPGDPRDPDRDPLLITERDLAYSVDPAYQPDPKKPDGRRRAPLYRRSRAVKTSLLCVDEVGRWAIAPPPYAKAGHDVLAELRLVLETRYAAGRPTLFACNPPAGDPGDPRTKTPPKLVRTRYGGALLSRWQQGRSGAVTPWSYCGDKDLRHDGELQRERAEYQRLAQERLLDPATSGARACTRAAAQRFLTDHKKQLADRGVTGDEAERRMATINSLLAEYVPVEGARRR